MDDETRAALIDACQAHQRNLSAYIVLQRLLRLPELQHVNPNGDSESARAVADARRWINRVAAEA